MLDRARPDWHPPLSTGSEEAVAHYLQGMHRHLSILPAAGRAFDNAHRADPAFGAAAAALAFSATAVGELQIAREALAAARLAAPTSPAMSRSHIEAIDGLLTGPAAPGLQRALRHLGEYPYDVFILAITLNALHTSGRRRRRQEGLALLDAAIASGVDHFAVPSMRSVVLADVGSINEAREDAEAGLAANPRSAHAAHGLAHVHYETGEHEAGRAWLTAWTADFDPRASGVHLSWHLALHDLALGDIEGLLARYDGAIRPHSTSSLYVDAVDILWRSRLSGVPVRERFEALQSVVAPVGLARTSLALTQSLVFLAGKGAVDGLGREVAALRPTVAAILPVARAMLAICHGQLPDAIAELNAIGGELVEIAGSNAQLDLVSQTLQWCHREAGSASSADVFLAARLVPGSAARGTGEWSPAVAS